MAKVLLGRQELREQPEADYGWSGCASQQAQTLREEVLWERQEKRLESALGCSERPGPAADPVTAK